MSTEELDEDLKDLIDKLNSEEISDILCTSEYEDRYVNFCLEIRTKAGNSFFFNQGLDLNPKFEDVEVLYSCKDDDCTVIAELPKFDRTTYKYQTDVDNQ